MEMLQVPNEKDSRMPELTRRALKDLDGLTPALREKAKSLIARLDSEPAAGHKLLGRLTGYRSARLGRSHRIIYKVPPQGNPIIMTIVPRKDAYR